MLQWRHVAHRWNPIIGKIRIHRPTLVDLQSFGERVADPLSKAAFNLSLGAERIDHGAAVGSDDELKNLYLAGFRIDVNLRGLGTVVVSAGLVAEAGAVRKHGVGVEAAGADDGRAVVAEQARPGDIRNGQ